MNQPHHRFTRGEGGWCCCITDDDSNVHIVQGWTENCSNSIIIPAPRKLEHCERWNNLIICSNLIIGSPAKLEQLEPISHIFCIFCVPCSNLIIPRLGCKGGTGTVLFPLLYVIQEAQQFMALQCPSLRSVHNYPHRMPTLRTVPQLASV